jgi:hypothetical protein
MDELYGNTGCEQRASVQQFTQRIRQTLFALFAKKYLHYELISTERWIASMQNFVLNHSCAFR